MKKKLFFLITLITAALICLPLYANTLEGNVAVNENIISSGGTVEPDMGKIVSYEETTEPYEEKIISSGGNVLPISGADAQYTKADDRNEIIERVVANTPKQEKAPINVSITDNQTENDNAIVKQKNCSFENGDYFWMRRYFFKNTTDGIYMSTVLLPGTTIEVRYVDPVTKDWAVTQDIDSLKDKKTTFFVTTDSCNAILSVAGVYKNSFENNTLTIMRDMEQPVTFSKVEGGFVANIKYPQNSGVIGEFWCLQSKNKLFDFSDPQSYETLKKNDLAFERRWCYDGYYFPTPYNYVPSGKDVLYRQPSNYTGASWAKYSSGLAQYDLGYIMTKICTKNQNESGFWATGPYSEWLKHDFNIGENFYDTRFNTDFATSLIYAYKNYNDPEFLRAVVAYAEYFCDYAAKTHYDMGGGWLVDDYRGGAESLRTHCSLNHQLAEIIFLYEVYDLTGERKYYDVAELMLLGIEATKDKWVLEDNNLNYALMYTGTYNTMVDYPYLTYNDLFNLKNLLEKRYQRTNETIEYLMSKKKLWMDANNVTDYLK